MLLCNVHSCLQPASAAWPRSVQPSPHIRRQHALHQVSGHAGHHVSKVSALFDPRDILPETLADDDEELITNPLAERLASIDDDLRDAEADHLRAQLALERERSAALSQRLGEAEGGLRVATARLNTRSVLDAAEDVMGAPDAGGRRFAAAAADARRAERADKWEAWAAANPEEAADLAAEAGWDLGNLANEVADLYEQIREAGARLPGPAGQNGNLDTKHSMTPNRRSSSGDDRVEPLAADDDTSSETSTGTSEDTSDDTSEDTSSDDGAAPADVPFGAFS